MTDRRKPGGGREPAWQRAAERTRREAQTPHETEDVSSPAVVAVFPSAAAAERAAAMVTAQVSNASVRVGDDAGHVAALRGEMAEEDARAFAGPSVGLYTREMARGAAWGVGVWTLIGVLFAAPFSLIPFGTMGIAGRLMIVAIIGAVAGGTVGFVAGGGAGAKGPAEPLAAEEGVTMSVHVTGDESRQRVLSLLEAAEPLRIDELRGGEPEQAIDPRPDRKTG